MSRVILTILATLFLFLTLPARTLSQPQSQSKCTLTQSQAPAIRGIKLGTSVEEVLSLFPESKQRPEIKDAIERAQAHPNYGIARLFFQPSNYLPAVQDRFAGIDSVSVIAFDGHVIEIRVHYFRPGSYPRGASWPNVDDFITKLSETFALPGSKDWLEKGENSKILKCSGFEVEASTLSRAGSISLRSSNTHIEKTVRERAAADEERKRREFKP